MDFKKRVQNSIISSAAIYKSVLLDFEYLLYSPKFTKEPYYIIGANEDNYGHLTGVHSLISAKDFFSKCYNGTISESEFDFIKGLKNEKSIKGSVRDKIIAFPFLAALFSNKLKAEENFSKGKVHCFIAAADAKITIGFVDTGIAIPKSLLRKRQLDHAKSVDVTLVLRRSKGSDRFNTIMQGDICSFCTFRSKFPDLLFCNSEECKNNNSAEAGLPTTPPQDKS